MALSNSRRSQPRRSPGLELALTEVLDECGHRFVVELGTEAGGEILAQLPTQPAEPAGERGAEAAVARAAAQQGRQIHSMDISDLLYRNLKHPRWGTTCASAAARLRALADALAADNDVEYDGGGLRFKLHVLDELTTSSRSRCKRATRSSSSS